MKISSDTLLRFLGGWLFGLELIIEMDLDVFQKGWQWRDSLGHHGHEYLRQWKLELGPKGWQGRWCLVGELRTENHLT